MSSDNTGVNSITSANANINEVRDNSNDNNTNENDTNDNNTINGDSNVNKTIYINIDNDNNANDDPTQVIADIDETKSSSTDFAEFDNNNNNGFVDFDNFDANISTTINDGAGFVEFDSFNADTAVTSNFDFDFTPTKLNNNIDNENKENNNAGIKTSLFSPSSSYDTTVNIFSPTVDHNGANTEINVDDNKISNDTNTTRLTEQVSNNNGIIYVSNEDDNGNYKDDITVVDDLEVSTNNNQNDQVQPQPIDDNIITNDDLDANINDKNNPSTVSALSDERYENNNNFNNRYDDQNIIDNKDDINKIDTNNVSSINATIAMDTIPNVDTNVSNTTKENKISTDTTTTINDNENTKPISSTNANASNVFIPIPSSPRRPSPSSIPAPTIKDKLKVDLFQEDASSIVDSKTSSISNPKEKLSLDLYAETTNETTNNIPDDEVDDEINLINRAKVRKTLSLSILVSEELVSINKEQGNFTHLTKTIEI